MPDRIDLEVFTWHSLRSKDDLDCLLSALETSDLAPTHWGLTEPVRNQYDRNAVIAGVSATGSHELYTPSLHRRKAAPRYEAFFSTSSEDLNFVNSKFQNALDIKCLSQIFALGDTLAENLEAELAFVHPIWYETNQVNLSPYVKVRDLQKYGLRSIGARTWLGPFLVKTIGRDLLYSCGAYAQDTSWGGIRLDLVKDPWQADVEALSDAQAKVMQNLDSSGIFGDYTNVLAHKPGNNWKSIPQIVQSTKI